MASSQLNWQYSNPTKLLVGEKWISDLGSVVHDLSGGNPRIVLFTGRTAARKNGYTERIVDSLGSSPFWIYDKIEPEPFFSRITDAAAFIEQNEANVALALGGGSVLDAAKAAACLAYSGLGVSTLWRREKTIGARKVKLVALPTTAGSGSEVTPFSVLTDDETRRKLSLPSPFLYPDLAVLSTSFLTTAPTKVIGDTGIDALAHAFEALWSVQNNPVSDALAFNAIFRITKNLVPYREDPENVAAAEQMMLGATLAGKAFSNTFTAACHALSFPIAAKFGLTHGHSCGMTLWLVADVNQGAVGQKYEYVARLLDLKKPSDVPFLIRDLRDSVQDMTRFSQLGGKKEDLDEIASNVFQPLLNNNPVTLDHKDLVALLARAF